MYISFIQHTTVLRTNSVQVKELFAKSVRSFLHVKMSIVNNLVLMYLFVAKKPVHVLSVSELSILTSTLIPTLGNVQCKLRNICKHSFSCDPLYFSPLLNTREDSDPQNRSTQYFFLGSAEVKWAKWVNEYLHHYY